MALTKTQVSELYVAIFGRASEGEGNTYWQGAADMKTAADQMLATPDATEYFGGSLTDREFIEHIYLNTLNKTAAQDPDGIQYWVDELANGATRGEVVANLVTAVESYADSTDPVTKAAYDQFMNRVEVSDASADYVTEAPSDYKYSLGFQSNANPNAYLNVTADPESVVEAKAQVYNITNPAQHLTAGVDDLTGNQFFASLTFYNVDGVGPTLNSGDRLTGVEGLENNTVTITDLTAGSANDLIPAGATLNNIQIVKLNSSGNTATGTGFDVSNYGSVKELIGTTNGGANDIFTASNSKASVNVIHNGFAGSLTVVGGTDVSATSVGGNIVVGAPAAGAVPLATQIATGAITVVQNNSGAGSVNVFGGTTVDVTVASSSNTGTVDVGNTTANTGNTPAGTITNPSGDVAVNTAGTGAVTIFGGKDVAVTDTALAGAGAITVGDVTYLDPSNLPAGAVTITETAAIAYDGIAGSGHNATISGAISVYGGTDITVETNAANTVNIGNLGATKQDALNPTGAISVKNTGVMTAAAAAAVNVTGGTTVDVETTGASVTVGVAANAGVIDNASNPTGNVTVTETMNGAGLGAQTVTVDGGADVTVNAKGQTVVIGGSANSAPTGAVTVNQSDKFTGNAAMTNVTGAGNVTVDGGTDVTVNTTGGNVTVGGVIGGASVVPSGSVSITNTFSGPGSDTVSVQGGTSVDITTTQTSGSITVGNTSNVLNATGTALKNPELAPTGDVTITDVTTAGSAKAYGTGNVNAYTNGATTVSVEGGDVDNLVDIQSTQQTGGANAGQPVGTSTLTDVVIDGSQSTDGIIIQSDALANLTYTNASGADTLTVTNNTSAHSLTFTQGGNKLATTLVDAKAGSVTVTDNATASTGVLTLQATKATALTVDNAAQANLNVGSIATDIATVTLQGAGATTFATTDIFGAGNLAKALTVDASAATGSVTLSLTAKTDTTAQSYKGSAGADTIAVTSNASGWGANVSVDGGNGSADTIVANYAATGTDVALGNDAHVKGFEKLGLGAAATGAYDASGFDEVKIGAVTGNITVNNAASGATLSVTADTTGGRTIDFNGANTTATTNTMTVNLGQADATSLTGGTNITVATGAITANGIETLTVNSTGGTLAAGNTATINDTSTNGSAKLVVTGDRALTLTSDAGFTEVDATAATAKVDVSAAAVSNNGTTFKGGDAQLVAVGSNASAVYKALVTISDTDATDLAAGDTVTVNVNGTTFVYTATAASLVSEVAQGIADAINTNANVTTTNGGVVKTGANVLTGAGAGAIASGGNIVLGDPTAPFEVTTAASHATTTVTASLLGGQQQDTITITTPASEANDKISIDINGTTVTYTASGADATAADSATGLANAINAANIAGISSATTDGAKVIITSQLGKTNVIDNLAFVDAGDGTTPAGTGPVETINMTTVSNLVESGAGGVDYTLGLGGSWDAVSHQFGSGSETINLANSTAVKDILRVNDGAVSTNNGATGGISNFVVDSQNASDTLEFATAGKTIAANAVTDNVSNVNGASTMANVLDSSGNLATKLSNLTYTISNGVVTFGATGGHSISEFTTGDLMSAAQILASSSTTGGANTVLAFSSNGSSYVVASDTANTLAAGTDSASIIVTLSDVADIQGFGSTFGEATVVSSTVTTVSNTAITALQASQTQDDTGFAIATLSGATQGTAGAVDTSTTNFNNLASSAELIVDDTATANLHKGTINVTQVGTSGHNSLTVSTGATNSVIIDTLNVSGDAEVYFNASAATDTISSLVDATDTMNTVTVNGAGGMLTSVTSNALTTVEAKDATGAFYFGVNATTLATNTAAADAHSNLTVDVADGQASLLNLAGANVTVTQDTTTTTGTGAVTVKTTGSAATIDLDNGSNNITALGANSTISVGTGANTIVATGSDDIINVDSGAATIITVGANAVVNLGNADAIGNPIVDAVAGADTIKLGDTATGGDSANYAKTTVNVLAGTHTGATDVVLDFSDTAGTITTTLLGTTMATSQVNVSEAASLAEALDMAANYTALTQVQGTLATTANLIANTGEITWFQYEGNTYVVEMVNSSASAVQQTGLDSDDIVVELTGLVDLSSATFNAGTEQLSY